MKVVTMEQVEAVVRQLKRAIQEGDSFCVGGEMTEKEKKV